MTEHLHLEPLPCDGALIPRCNATHRPRRSNRAKWSSEGHGPRHVRLGRRVYYRSEDVREWLEARITNQ